MVACECSRDSCGGTLIGDDSDRNGFGIGTPFRVPCAKTLRLRKGFGLPCSMVNLPLRKREGDLFEREIVEVRPP